MSGAIRPATQRDAADIRAVHLAAFPGPVEADLVEALDRDGDAVISLVAEVEGRVVGHVLLSRMRVSGGDRTYCALGLAPIGVTPGFQGTGIGKRLIEKALAAARDAGEELVFLLGEPGYYRRFGFSTDAATPFASPYAGPYFMALALREDLAMPERGEAAYAPAFAEFE